MSTAEAPVEYSRKFLPREILSLNATYKHLNIVRVLATPAFYQCLAPLHYLENLPFALAYRAHSHP